MLSPELLKILSEMGHGDELVIADRNFPSASMCGKVVADAAEGASMLKAVLSVFPLDQYDNRNVGLMKVCEEDSIIPHIMFFTVSVPRQQQKSNNCSISKNLKIFLKMGIFYEKY